MILGEIGLRLTRNYGLLATQTMIIQILNQSNQIIRNRLTIINILFRKIIEQIFCKQKKGDNSQYIMNELRKEKLQKTVQYIRFNFFKKQISQGNRIDLEISLSLTISIIYIEKQMGNNSIIIIMLKFIYFNNRYSTLQTRMIKVYNQKMLKFISSLFFIILIHNCETELKSALCGFSVTPKDVNCTSLILKQCSWQQCVAFAMIGRALTCIRYQTFTKNTWESCMDQCCPNSGPATYDTLHQCIDEVNKQMMIIWIVFGSIMGLLMIFGITIVIIMAYKKFIHEHGSCANFISNCCKKRGQVEPMQETAPQIIINRVTAQTELNLFDKWKKSDHKFISSDESCSICLNSLPNIQLQCKHLYHYKCILDWIERRSKCPICSSQINKFSINCNKCWKKQKQIILNQNNGKIIEENPTCGSCSMSQN